MFRVEPYSKELMETFIYDGVERKLFDKDQMLNMIEFYNRLGKSYIGLVDNKVLGIGGMYPLWKGAGSVWLFLNKEAKQYKKFVFKTLLAYIDSLIKEYGIKTLIIECVDDSLEAHRLIQHLGFVKSREVKMSLYFKQMES